MSSENCLERFKGGKHYTYIVRLGYIMTKRIEGVSLKVLIGLHFFVRFLQRIHLLTRFFMECKWVFQPESLSL